MDGLKFILVMILCLSTFICFASSIWFSVELGYEINCPQNNEDYLLKLQDKSCVLSIFGHRFFYLAFSFATWIFSPILMLVVSIIIISGYYFSTILFSVLLFLKRTCLLRHKLRTWPSSRERGKVNTVVELEGETMIYLVKNIEEFLNDPEIVLRCEKSEPIFLSFVI